MGREGARSGTAAIGHSQAEKWMNGDDRWEKISDAQESTIILLFKMLPTVLPTVLSTVPTSQNPISWGRTPDANCN